jgi:hypothetical protein
MDEKFVYLSYDDFSKSGIDSSLKAHTFTMNVHPRQSQR